jgi:dihydroxyacetone kinase-like protein
VNGAAVVAGIDAAQAAVAAHHAEILALDQAIGDGDHVLNLLRGLEALQGLRAQLEVEELAAALKRAGGKVLSTVGGSSGPLFATLLLGMAQAAEPQGGPAGLARMFAAGVRAVQERGKTGRGSKTMMDVLIPVSERFLALAEAGTALPALADELVLEAERGMFATRDMLATKGRASFLGERSLGHIDPGARSSQLMISAVCLRLRGGGPSEGGAP